jgi:hypothetical protein
MLPQQRCTEIVAHRGASALWGEFRQQIFLTQSREEREGKRFLWLFHAFAAGSFFSTGIQTSLRSLRLCGFAASREKCICP